MKVLDTVHQARLSKALLHSYEELSWARQSYRQLIEDYAGPRYGSEFLERPEVYINLMQTAAEAQRVALTYNEPRFKVTPYSPEKSGFAERYQIALDSYSKSIHLRQTMAEIVLDAIFLVGIGKIYLADSPFLYSEDDGATWIDPGRPFFGRLSFANWVHDCTKGHFNRAQFHSDRYYMDLERAQACPSFKKNARNKLQASDPSERSDFSELPEALSVSDQDDYEIEPQVAVCDVYLPKDRIVCTWAIHDKYEIIEGDPLSIQEVEDTPYSFLGMMDVPDNIMPTSPAQTMAPLGDLVNYLMRKQVREWRQSKRVIPYVSGAHEDMQRMMHAEDGQTIQISHMDAVKVMEFPGPDQSLGAFTLGMMNLFKEYAGNIDAMLGLNPTAGTLGQSEMIAGQVGARLAESRRRVNQFLSQAAERLGKMMFDDPVLEVPGERRVAGLSISANWTPEMERQGSPSDYGVCVEPYSMEYKSPQERLGSIMQAVQAITPLLPMAQQQGQEFQFQELWKDIADLSNEPRLLDYFRSAPPPMELPQGQAQPMGGANKPNGNYTRTNVSEKTNGGELEQLLAQQPQQQAGMMAG